MKRVIYSIGLAALTVSTSLFMGCMSSVKETTVVKEPTFQQIDMTSHSNEALIYFYRPSKWGVKMAFSIAVADQFICKLPDGGYYPYFTKPGTYNFQMYTIYVAGGVPDVTITLEAGAGQVYYFRAKTGNFANSFEAVPPDIAEKEITKCKLVR